MHEARGVSVSRIVRPIDGDLSATLERTLHYIPRLEAARWTEHTLIQ
jgi:hypothetical protein